MNYPLYKSLHRREMTQAKLSTLTGLNRTVIARLLTNEPGRGKETRHKLFPHLVHDEIRLLGWVESYNQWIIRERPTRMTMGFGGQIDMEQCSTGNIVPAGGAQ